MEKTNFEDNARVDSTAELCKVIRQNEATITTLETKEKILTDGIGEIVKRADMVENDNARLRRADGALRDALKHERDVVAGTRSESERKDGIMRTQNDTLTTQRGIIRLLRQDLLAEQNKATALQQRLDHIEKHFKAAGF